MLILAAGCEDNAVPDTLNYAAEVGALSISPSSVSLGAIDTFTVFSASGGTPPYSWAISDATMGSIPTTTSATITYSRSGTTLGANTISVTDQNNWSASAVIYQTTNTTSGI